MYRNKTANTYMNTQANLIFLRLAVYCVLTKEDGEKRHWAPFFTKESKDEPFFETRS